MYFIPVVNYVVIHIKPNPYDQYIVKYSNLVHLSSFDPHLTHSLKVQGHILFQMVYYVGTHVKTNASMFQSQDIEPKTL